MQPRSITEDHRAATPLELFFDLCFVVAVAQAASRLHHAVAEGHAGDALLIYPAVFFGVWWAWMNFTWFASAYDTDDVPYRLAVLVQIAGVLIFAAGLPRAFDRLDFGLGVLGYVVMRVALIALWLRAARANEAGRRCALRYAAGIGLCQVGWTGLLAASGGLWLAGFAVLGVCEGLVPIWAERAGPTSWHPGHIAERYGLFTLIVLGECVLAASTAVQAALDSGEAVAPVATVAAGGLLIVFSMWWIYFDLPAGEVVDRARRSFSDSWRPAFAWGYGHFVVFASAAAVGAGLQVAVDRATHHAEVSEATAGAAVTVPVALYLFSVWALHFRQKRPGPFRVIAVPATAVLLVASMGFGQPVLAVGVVLAGLVGVSIVVRCWDVRSTG
jgi:low temperature requirement protein LtrA